MLKFCAEKLLQDAGFKRGDKFHKLRVLEKGAVPKFFQNPRLTNIASAPPPLVYDGAKKGGPRKCPKIRGEAKFLGGLCDFDQSHN